MISLIAALMIFIALVAWSACRNFNWTEDHCDRTLPAQNSGRSHVED
jgi:hypothetical protein